MRSNPVSPEAAEGGPIGLFRDGDLVEIDIRATSTEGGHGAT